MDLAVCAQQRQVPQGTAVLVRALSWATVGQQREPADSMCLPLAMHPLTGVAQSVVALNFFQTNEISKNSYSFLSLGFVHESTRLIQRND